MKKHSPPVVAVVLVTLLVAVIDFWTSAELVGSILFTFPLALCARQGSKRLLWGTAVAVVLLTVTAEFWGFGRPQVAVSSVGVVNRVLLVASLLTLTTIIHFRLELRQKMTLDAAATEGQRHRLGTQKERLEVLVTEAARDLEQRVEGEKHLAQMESRYRGLLEAAPDAMVVVDQSGKIVLVNLQAKKQFGYVHDELLGRQVTSIIPEGFAERLIADGTRTAAEALAQQIGTGIELAGRRKDGSTFPIEIMLSPLESAEGILVTAAVRNISVRKDAERHLAMMEGRYRGLLEAAPDPMVLVNQSDEIVLVNLQAERAFGYRRDDLVGSRASQLLSETSVAQLVAYTRRDSDGAFAEQSTSGIDLDGRRKDGSLFQIEVTLSRLETDQGILLTVAIRNITTRKKAEALLLRTVAELNRSNEELGQFAYIASHDLQEPLRMVASYTQLLSRRYKGKLDSDADEFIAFAVDGANRMQRLIQDLLEYSRVGTKERDLVDVSSEAALERALLNLRGAIEESGAQVTHDPLPSVRVDEGQLIQLFQNLIGNALKYHGPQAPRVHVWSTRNGGSRSTFSVKDNGLGIESKYFDKIFGMFQRLHNRNDFAGTGIGLAICKKIVERHGGNISVESEVGHGSTFSFALEGAATTS